MDFLVVGRREKYDDVVLMLIYASELLKKKRDLFRNYESTHIMYMLPMVANKSRSLFSIQAVTCQFDGLYQ